MPLRALWSWPLAFGVIGVVELWMQSGRLGVGAGAWLPGLLAASMLGVWPAALAGLVALLVQRRWGDNLPRLPEQIRARLAVALTASVPLVAIGYQLVAPVFITMENHPIDYREVSVQAGEAAVLAVGVLAVVVMYPLARVLEPHLMDPRRRAWAIRVSGTGLALGLLAHLCSGPFVLKFGKPVAPVLVLILAAAASSWLPRRVVVGRTLGLHATGLLVLTVVGILGWRSPATRAALLHDTRVMPEAMRLGLGFLDGDGDGDMPPWIGGQDCEDGDPAVAVHRPEVPGNGLDDNCHGGDATPRDRPNAGPVEGGPRPHVVLVTLDAVRAHNLQSLGHERNTMPNLEARKAKGRWFERAMSPANHTYFSVMSLLSGQSPERLVVDGDREAVSFTFWFPHRMAQLGYRTVAIHPPLLGQNIPFSELRFQELSVGPWDFDGRNRGGTARQRITEVERLFESLDGSGPLFLWLHLYDAHAFHEAHEMFPVRDTVDAYDNELFWIDVQLGRLFEMMDRELGPDTVFILTADHGETFGERGAYGHGHGLHDIEVHVPLLVEGPGVDPGVVPDPVSAASIVPTVLELLGQPEEPRISYPSLLGGPPAGVTMENPFGGDERRWDAAYLEGRWKLSISRSRQTRVLFDLEADPGEWNDVAAEHPAEADRLEAALWERLEAAR